MNIQITGRHIEITQALREFIEKKFKKLERHFNQMTQIQVILSVKKGLHCVEAKLHIPHHEIFAEQESEDMYAAIDVLITKLDRQILKQKDKNKTHTGIDKRSLPFRDEEE